MENKGDKVAVAVLTVMLLVFYAVAPAIGAPVGKVTVIHVNEDGSRTDITDKNKIVSDSSKRSISKSLDDKVVTEEVKEEEEEEEESLSSKLNPFNMGKKMVGEGGVYFLELVGDAGFSVTANTTQDSVSVKENYGQAVALIYTLASIEFDPSKNQFIKEVQVSFAIIGFFLILMFIIMGAFSVNVFAITSKRNAENAWILSNRYHVPINEYALTMAEAAIMLSTGYILLRISIMLELLFTKMIMFQILDRISPTGGNIVMYLMMSICYLIISLAIAYRILIIGLFHATFITFIGLYCFGLTRPVARSAAIYYLKMLFLRPIIVGITVVGVGIISEVNVKITDGLLYLTPDSTTAEVAGAAAGTAITAAGALITTLVIQPILYAALIIILVIVCVIFMVGVKDVARVTKVAARRYTLGVYK